MKTTLEHKNFFLKLAEIVLATGMFFVVVYFGVVASVDFLYMDWSNITTMYDFIALVLAVLLGLEVVRMILIHNIAVAIELILLIIARKMLNPDIQAFDFFFYTISFSIIAGTYYLYKLKPLKNLED